MLTFDKTIYPKIAEIVEARSIANFDWLTRWTSSNAKNETKIDIVNPMPPRQPAPRICFQQTEDDNLDQPKETTKNENNIIPRGLPSTKPRIIPRSKELEIVAKENFSITKAVLAKAKMGMINKATGKCKNFSNLLEMLFSSPLPKGITKASRTPLIDA